MRRRGRRGNHRTDELTRAIHLLDEVAQRLGTARPPEHELQEIKRDIQPEKVVEEIEKAESRSGQ